MIGLFKKKEQNNKINLSNYFNWIKSLHKQKLELSNQDLDERLSQSKLVYKFLKSDKFFASSINPSLIIRLTLELIFDCNFSFSKCKRNFK